MAVPEENRPGRGMPPRPGAAGNRPVAAGPTYPGGAGAAGGSFSNRPILLKARASDDLPDADEDEDLGEEDDTDLREILRNAPAWLVSMVFHMLLLIVMGLFAYTVHRQNADLQVEVTYAPDLGEQMLDASALDSGSPELETLPEQMITPPDLTPVDDPLAAPPELAEIDLARPTIPAVESRVEGAPIGLALKGREIGSRNALLQRYGGTADTEAAVEAGLQWLVKQQKKDGSWSLQGPYEDQASSENVPAATAMALLAFQGHGDTHREGKYAKVVASGWEALLKMQRADGLFTGKIGLETQMLYTHAQCTIALCELYGMTQDSRFRGPAEKAIAFCVDSQDRQRGGWRYRPRQESDTSVTGWFVMAFQSARMAKLPVPPDVLRRVSDYLDSAQIDGGRRYGYLLDKQETKAVSAEGLLCRQYLGWKQDDPRLVEGISSLVKNGPIVYDKGPDHDVYYWYYLTQAAHHMEGTIWDDWNKNMRQIVPENQVKKGPEAGSWDPVGDKWASWNGRLYMTCLSIYMLEVYYRHLPIYSGYEFIAGVGKTMNPEATPEAPEVGGVPAAGEKPDAEKSPDAKADSTADSDAKSGDSADEKAKPPGKDQPPAGSDDPLEVIKPKAK